MKQLNWYQIFGNTHTIPDGRTVTPTDDIQIWLNCANIWDKAYTTLYEVLNDTATLSALMASDNAVDYLVRSTSWAVPISVPIMTSNTTPSGVCIASSEDYPAYYAFNGNTSNGWASVTVGTSNLGRVGYEFTEAVDIKKVSLLHGNNANFTCKVQYSDDGVNWTDVEDSTFTAVKNTQANVSFDSGSHLYWAVYYLSASATTRASVNELQFYSASITTDSNAMTYIGQNNYCANTLLADATWAEAIGNSDYIESVMNVKVPAMTDNTHPYGTCIRRSSGDSTTEAWKAFDGGSFDIYDSSSVYYSVENVANEYLGYIFLAACKIRFCKVALTSNSTDARTDTVKIQASNDSFTTPVDMSDSINVRVQRPNISKLVVMLDTTNSYSGFRLLRTSSSGRFSVQEMQFYGREDV